MIDRSMAPGIFIPIHRKKKEKCPPIAPRARKAHRQQPVLFALRYPPTSSALRLPQRRMSARGLTGEVLLITKFAAVLVISPGKRNKTRTPSTAQRTIRENKDYYYVVCTPRHHCLYYVFCQAGDYVPAIVEAIAICMHVDFVRKFGRVNQAFGLRHGLLE